jgi:dienelactone hydrolase
MKRLVLLYLFLPALYLSFANSARAADLHVSFKTRRGNLLHATLSLPQSPFERVPAVVLLSSPGPARSPHQQSASDLSELAPIITNAGAAVLTLPSKQGNQLKTGLSQSLDVRAAIDFLATQKGIDDSRLGIVAAGATAQAALDGCRGDTRVSAIALLSGRLDAKAKDQIAESPDLSLLFVVSAEDKKGFADMTDAYLRSREDNADIRVFNDLGSGPEMFNAFRDKYPKETPLSTSIGQWVANQLLSDGDIAEVSFQTEDGWTLFGNLRLPQKVQGKLPAVILLHSGLSDRFAYHDLELALARSGLAVLNFDWRGKGKSTGKGHYFELTKAERDKGYLDAKAAVNYLATLNQIDASRIGILGTVIGAKYAMAAAAEEPRIKTAVVLTGYIPTEKEKTYFSTQNRPVLLITSRGHQAVTTALTAMYDLTKEKGSQIVVYDGGAIGYQLFDLDHRLIARLVAWMRQHL